MKYKRKLIQWAAFGFSNAYVPNFIRGTVYKGPLKQLCVPGLNCYSCPGALGSCPLGALQTVIGSYQYSFSFYVVGLLLAFGVVLGRFICGFLCPFGLFQELLYRIPGPKLRLPGWCRYLKYAVLIVFVIGIPLLVTNYMGMGKPAFCQYICPAGTLEGGIPLLLTNPVLRNTVGWLFSLKSVMLVLTVIGSILIYRCFCRVLCPLGAIYALFNRISIYRLHWDQDACIGCGKCAQVCKMGVSPHKQSNAGECIRCGDCVNACPTHALKAGFDLGWRKKTAVPSQVTQPQPLPNTATTATTKHSHCRQCGHCGSGRSG